MAVISLAGIVYAKSVRIGGDKLDEAIIQYVKRKYNLLIGERTAELIKMGIGTAYPTDEVMTMEIKGRDLVAGVPRTLTVTSDEIRDALARAGQRHRRGGEDDARAHAARARRRHRRPRHRARRRRRAAQEPGHAAARGDRPAGVPGRGPALGGGDGRGQGARVPRDSSPGLPAGVSRPWQTLAVVSRALHRTLPCTLLLPEGRRPEAVLYLLHGGYSHHAEWAEKMDLAGMASRWPLALALPEGGFSLWLRGDDGQDFLEYAATEVPKAVEAHLGLSLSRGRRAVAGLSMGGFGAFQLGLTYPERFGAVASLSGAFGISWWNLGRTEDSPFLPALGPMGSATRDAVHPLRTLERALARVGPGRPSANLPLHRDGRRRGRHPHPPGAGGGPGDSPADSCRPGASWGTRLGLLDTRDARALGLRRRGLGALSPPVPAAA